MYSLFNFSPENHSSSKLSLFKSLSDGLHRRTACFNFCTLRTTSNYSLNGVNLTVCQCLFMFSTNKVMSAGVCSSVYVPVHVAWWWVINMVPWQITPHQLNDSSIPIGLTRQWCFSWESHSVSLWDRFTISSIKQGWKKKI